MEEWKEYRLGDLYDVHNGLSKGGQFFGSGYPFLSFKTVFNNYFLPSILPDLVLSNEKEQNGYDIKRGDVFVTRTSETSEELGMSSVALKDYPFATYNGFTKRLRPKDDSVVCPEFIGYYLRSSKFRALFYGLASSMSTRASLANGDLLGMKAFLPSVETQKRIAFILKSLDDKIEVNRRINDNLEQQALALFKSWFVDFEPFKEGKFVDSELGMIPEGWRVGTLGEIAEVNPPRTLKKGQSATYLDMKNMPTSGSFPSTWETKEYNGGMKFKNEDTIMARITPCLENGKVAYVNFLDNGEIAFGSTEYIVMTPKDGFMPELFYFLCRDDQFKGYATKNMNGSSGRQRVSGETIGNYKIAIPPKELLLPIASYFKSVMDLIKKNGFETRFLASIRDSLLPKLMSGEIKV